MCFARYGELVGERCAQLAFCAFGSRLVLCVANACDAHAVLKAWYSGRGNTALGTSTGAKPQLLKQSVNAAYLRR